MFRLVRCIFSVSLLVTGACAQTKANGDEKVQTQFYTAKDRLQAIRNATVFNPQAVSQLDIAQGPGQKKDEFQLHPNDKVICDFATPGSQMGGNTAKFGCKITRIESANGQVQTLSDTIHEEDPVKVKYGSGDNEVYAEVAASRLLWALGFYTDAWYPVRVECHVCPADPDSGKGAADTRVFDPAIIVRKLKGHKMYEIGNEAQGWSWKELEAVNGRPTHEKDGLALLAAFLVHSDNKPPQQRLVCNQVNVDQTTKPFTTTCDHSEMVVQDLGATFGGGGLFTSNDGAKMNLDEWSGSALWKKVGTGGPDCPECQGRLKEPRRERWLGRSNDQRRRPPAAGGTDVPTRGPSDLCTVPAVAGSADAPVSQLGWQLQERFERRRDRSAMGECVQEKTGRSCCRPLSLECSADRLEVH